MKLKKNYTFLYLPEDEGPSRQFVIPRWTILGTAGLAVFLLCLAGLYGVGIWTGNSWLPGGSRLQKENLSLRTEIAGLGDQVQVLRDQMDSVYESRNLMAAALELPEMDRSTYQAGIGGRTPLTATTLEMPQLQATATDADVVPNSRLAALGLELDLLCRQARLQKQGYVALLDTLSERADIRGKIPSIRPVDTGWLSSRFGFRSDPFTEKQTFHRGLDFSVPAGTSVRATGDGIVLAVQQQRGLGKVVKISHGNDILTVYAHLSKILVDKGQVVSRGEIVAESGNSGRSTAPHLHYEIRIAGRPVNPAGYILDSYASRR